MASGGDKVVHSRDFNGGKFGPPFPREADFLFGSGCHFHGDQSSRVLKSPSFRKRFLPSPGSPLCSDALSCIHWNQKGFPSHRPPRCSGARKLGQVARRGDALGSRSNPKQLCLHLAAFLRLAMIPLLLQVPACPLDTGGIFHNPCSGSQGLKRQRTKTPHKRPRTDVSSFGGARLLGLHIHLAETGLTPVTVFPKLQPQKQRSPLSGDPPPRSAPSAGWYPSRFSCLHCWALRRTGSLSSPQCGRGIGFLLQIPVLPFTT